MRADGLADAVNNGPAVSERAAGSADATNDGPAVAAADGPAVTERAAGPTEAVNDGTAVCARGTKYGTAATDADGGSTDVRNSRCNARRKDQRQRCYFRTAAVTDGAAC
jgi:hypothetical protein